MAKIVISGTGAGDGEYPLDLSYLTNRELHVIKTVAGLRVAEIEEAIRVRDNDLVVALAAIAVKRFGREVPLDVLWDAHAGSITLDLTDEDAADDEESLPPQNAPVEPGDSDGS